MSWLVLHFACVLVMFLFIASLSKRRIFLGKGITEQDCLNCLKSSVPNLTRDDSWLSLFFFPVIRLKKGNQTYTCQWCGSPIDFSLSKHEREVLVQARRNMAGYMSQQSLCCPACKSLIFLLNIPSNKKTVHFCPYCGAQVVINAGWTSSIELVMYLSTRDKVCDTNYK